MRTPESFMNNGSQLAPVYRRVLATLAAIDNTPTLDITNFTTREYNKEVAEPNRETKISKITTSERFNRTTHKWETVVKGGNEYLTCNVYSSPLKVKSEYNQIPLFKVVEEEAVSFKTKNGKKSFKYTTVDGAIVLDENSYKNMPKTAISLMEKEHGEFEKKETETQVGVRYHFAINKEIYQWLNDAKTILLNAGYDNEGNKLPKTATRDYAAYCQKHLQMAERFMEKAQERLTNWQNKVAECTTVI